MAHRPFIRKSTPSRRKMVWFGGIDVSSIPAAASTAVLQTSLNAAALLLRPFTIVRTRGRVCCFSDQAAASEFFSVTYGKIIVTDQAVAAGVASVPTPTTDPANDWFVYKTMMQRVDFSDATGIRLYGLSEEFDSKAMRKVDIGQDLIGVIETSALSNGTQIVSFSRTLVKLS